MLYDFVWQENLYTKDECREIIEIAKKNPSKHWLDRPGSGKKVNVIVAEQKPFKKKLKRFFDFIELKNQEYFEFDLHEPKRAINFNFYSGEQNEYGFHRDSNNCSPRSDVKLTVLLNLSQEPYEGGDLELYFGDEIKVIEVLRQTGTVFMFPSFLYHRVAPVTKGERITMSYWARGPSWK